MTLDRYDPPARMPALINPTTDSWTAVLAEVISLASNITNTEFVPQGLRGNVPKVVAAILHGRELGLPPMTALAHTSVINGRPGTSAEVMRALILQAGHDLQIMKSDSEGCTIRGRRADWSEDRWTTVSFTMTDAAKAGLLEDKRTKEGKTVPSMYKKWPAELLLARASTRLARMIFADVIHGMRSVEELQDMTEVGEWVEPTTPAPTVQVSRQSATPAPAVEEEPQAAPGGAAPTAMGGVPAGAAGSEQRPPAAPARKKAPLTPRGKATQPAPEPAPEPQIVPDEDGVVEAEVVEEPKPEANVTPLAGARAEIRQKNVALVQMHWERILGKPVDRDERIWWTRVLVGNQEIESTNDLDTEGLRTLLGKLERIKDREHLEAMLTTKGGE